MGVIKVVEYNGPDPHDVFAWKFVDGTGRSDELSTWTQLVVRESQEAILFKNGQAFDLFPAGRHTLSTNNIPLISTFMNLPYGGKSPFKAEVWYVNKLYSLDIKWGTPTPIQIQDPQYGVWLPVRSYGQFGIRIADSRKFLLKLVGNVALFTKENLTRFFRGLLTTRIKDLISSYIVIEKKTILELNAYLNEISAHMEEEIRPILGDYGIELVNFFANSVNVPDDDPVVIQLKNALVKKAEMDILGYSYQQERSFDTLEKAAENEGNGAGLMQAGIGLGMGVGVGGAFGQTAARMTEELRTDGSKEQAKTSGITCSNCGAFLPNDAQFCSQCGRKIRLCQSCGNDIPDEAMRCPVCGASVPVQCSQCGNMVGADMRFCPFCGREMKRICPSCGKNVDLNARFCPSCGQKLDENPIQ